MSTDNKPPEAPPAAKVTAAQVMERIEALAREVGEVRKEVAKKLAVYAGASKVAARDRVVIARLVAARHELAEAQRLIEAPQEPTPLAEIRVPMGATLQQAQREMILQTLVAEGGHRSRTAARLGISRRTLQMALADALAEGADVPKAPSRPRRRIADEANQEDDEYGDPRGTA